jgi:hypothetical protein
MGKALSRQCKLIVIVVNPSSDAMDLDVETVDLLSSAKDLEVLSSDLAVAGYGPRLIQCFVPRVLEERKVPEPGVAGYITIFEDWAGGVLEQREFIVFVEGSVEGSGPTGNGLRYLLAQLVSLKRNKKE